MSLIAEKHRSVHFIAARECGPCKYGARCNEQGLCTCPGPCLLTESRVCANDSVSYLNECQMQSAACLDNVTLQVAHPGECEPTPNSPGKQYS